MMTRCLTGDVGVMYLGHLCTIAQKRKGNKMQLIDKDNFKKELNMGNDCDSCENDWTDCGYDKVYTQMNVCGLIDNAQSIDITKKIPFYRAKHINSDRYEDGFYFAMPETTYCFTEDYERHPVKIHHFIINHRMSDWGLPNRTEGTEIDPDTLKFIGWFTVRDSYGTEPWVEGENNGD